MFNAFLYGLTERVFMEQPPRYVVQGETTHVCYLHPTIYGLKQSPFSWFVKFSQLILSQGLTLCEVDPTFFWTCTFARCIILVVYVDSILVTRRDIVCITQAKAYLHQYIIVQDLGTPKYFLGIELASWPRK